MNIAAKRKSLGMSQSQLADMSGVSRWKISQAELGKRNLNKPEKTRIKFSLNCKEHHSGNSNKKG